VHSPPLTETDQEYGFSRSLDISSSIVVLRDIIEFLYQWGILSGCQPCGSNLSKSAFLLG